MRLKKITVILALFIIASAAFMNKVLSWFYERFGRPTFALILLIIFLSCALGFILHLARYRFRPLRMVLLVVFFILTFYFLWQIKILAERVHLFEYGCLGYLAMRDLKNKNKIKGTGISFIFVLAVGIIDEIFQAILPYRFGTVPDVMLNAVSGIAGIILFWISK